MSGFCASPRPPTPTAFWNATPSPIPLCSTRATSSRRKNLPRLIEAFAVAKAELRDHPDYSNLKLLLIGDSAEEHSDLRRAVLRSRLQGEVRFLGFVPHSVLRVFYSRASAFLFPSLYEGFGLPPLEAMAHGTPVLTSSVSSLPEVFSQAALLVNPENVFEIARGIRQILTEDDLRETLVRRGYELVRKYSWERSAEQVREVYRSVAAGEPAKKFRVGASRSRTTLRDRIACLSTSPLTTTAESAWRYPPRPLQSLRRQFRFSIPALYHRGSRRRGPDAARPPGAK